VLAVQVPVVGEVHVVPVVDGGVAAALAVGVLVLVVRQVRRHARTVSTH
jgi:uncharacterized protein (TIGR03382 family)